MASTPPMGDLRNGDGTGGIVSNSGRAAHTGATGANGSQGLVTMA
jgi:hypothetical protein